MNNTASHSQREIARQQISAIGKFIRYSERGNSSHKGKFAYKLLNIDELGYVPPSPTGAKLLFEVFSQRGARGSAIATMIVFSSSARIVERLSRGPILASATICRFRHF